MERPRAIYIDGGSIHEKLYRLEEKRADAVQAAAVELAKLLKHKAADFWGVTMPQALYDVLERYSPSMVRLVCQAWLEDHPEDA